MTASCLSVAVGVDVFVVTVVAVPFGYKLSATSMTSTNYLLAVVLVTHTNDMKSSRAQLLQGRCFPRVSERS